MDDHVRRQQTDAVDQQADVFVPTENGKRLPLIKIGQPSAAQDVEQLQLDPVQPPGKGGQPADALQHLVSGFARKAQNDVDDDGKSGFLQAESRVGKDGKRIAAANETGRRFMDGLQPQLYPDRFLPVQARQQADGFVR